MLSPKLCDDRRHLFRTVYTIGVYTALKGMTMSTNIKLLTASALTARIADITKTAKQLKADAQQAIVSALALCLEHGDVTNINKLCDALSGATSNNAIPRWFNEYGKGVITWDSKAKAFAVNKVQRKAIVQDAAKVAEMKDAWCDTSVTKPYYELTKAPKFQPFDVSKEFAKLIKKASDRVELGDDRDNVTKADLDKLMSAFKTFNQAEAVRFELDNAPITVN